MVVVPDMCRFATTINLRVPAYGTNLDINRGGVILSRVLLHRPVPITPTVIAVQHVVTGILVIVHGNVEGVSVEVRQ